MNNKQITQILQELYELDPKLKNQERELIKIINKILASRPNTKFDKKFAKKLRAELLAKAGQPIKNASLLNSLINLFAMKKLSYVAGGAVLTALILIPVLNYLNQNKITPAFDLGVKISRVGDNAFGALEPEANPISGQAESAAPLGLGAGDVRTQSGGGGGFATSESAMIMPPEYLINYKYVYNGEPITLTGEKLAILKRIKGSANAGQIAGLLKSFNLGLADLSSFADSKIQNITFTQDRPYGYIINANLEEGSLTIFQNWQTWPQSQCQDEKCFEAQRVTIGDVPSDQTLIKIADDFLANTKISLENYGEPFIDNTWRTYYTQTQESYVPDTLTVIYPLEIEGKGVYEGHGYPNGINIMVNIKEKKVMGVTNLFTQNYQSSMYEAETDIDKIMKFVEIGGIYSYSYGSDRTYEVELGEPKIGYFRKFNYNNGQNDELLVPALVFPVISAPQIDQSQGKIAPYFNKQNVVVPLIKEVLSEFEQGNDGGPIRILPMPELIPLAEPAIETDTAQ